MNLSAVVFIAPYVAVAVFLRHKQQKPCKFSRPSWLRAAAACAIFLCLLTFAVLSINLQDYPDSSTGIIAGWEPDRDLRVAAFVGIGMGVATNDSNPYTAVPLDEGSLCSSPLLLLVVVCSSPANHALRMAIRRTWASIKDSSVKVVFLFGQPQDASYKLQDRILRESEVYNDVIQEDFIDSYNNLTLKSVMMLKWFTQNCRQTRYIFKSDDDMFLNYRILKSSLSEPFPRGITPENFLGGTLIRGARPVRDGTHKWYMPSYLYPQDRYPNYLSGTGYLMSRQVAEKLYEASFEVKMIHMEDIYITGLCAQKAGIKPIPFFGFTLSKVHNLDCKSRYFMSHRMTPDDMLEAWSKYTACPETYVKSIFQDRKFGLWEKVKNSLKNR